MAKQTIAEAVKTLLEPIITELGYEIWDVEYIKEGAGYYLRITIDNEEGVNINDCERVHRAVDPILDEADPIEDSYYLQISSPGIERTINTDRHLNYALGKKLDIKLYKAADGSKTFVGVLKAFDNDTITVTVNEKEFTFERKNISKLSIHFDFEE